VGTIFDALEMFFQEVWRSYTQTQIYDKEIVSLYFPNLLKSVM